jgi:DNA-binding response OmpR family regulator
MKRRVLIVGKKREFVEWIREELEKRTKLLAVTAVSSSDGLELALQLKPHLILVDTDVAGPEGHRFCKRLRHSSETREVSLLLFLDELGAEAQALILKLRAHDFITKPVVVEELVSKVRVLLKRRRADRLAHYIFDDGCLHVHFAAYVARVGGRDLKMPLKEFTLLKFLVQNQGRIFSRDKLIDAVWGNNPPSNSRTLDVHMCRLRMKLGPEAQDYIQTIIGVGYSFRPPNKSAPKRTCFDSLLHVFLPTVLSIYPTG